VTNEDAKELLRILKTLVLLHGIAALALVGLCIQSAAP
jgi:hypothetical protein